MNRADRAAGRRFANAFAARVRECSADAAAIFSEEVSRDRNRREPERARAPARIVGARLKRDPDLVDAPRPDRMDARARRSSGFSHAPAP